MSSKSDTWNHFVKKGSSGICKHCHIEVKTCGNTTNLRNHLLRRHACIKTVSQRKQVVANNDIGGGKKQTEVCTCFCTLFLQCTTYVSHFFLSMHACLKIAQS